MGSILPASRTSSDLVRGGGVVAARSALGWISWCTSRCRFSTQGSKGLLSRHAGRTHTLWREMARCAHYAEAHTVNKKHRMVVWYPPKCCNAVLSIRYFETLPPVTQN